MKFGFSLRSDSIEIRREAEKIEVREIWWAQGESRFAYWLMCFSPFAQNRLRDFGGLKWTRTTDLTLIRRAL